MREDSDYLAIAGLAHFAFCRRRWALIFIEQQWAENLLTMDGHIFHQRAHDESLSERRGELLVVRGLRVASEQLGVSGICDVVEFHLDPAGVPLQGQDGLWRAVPVEYKRGRPNRWGADELQLCAQALCLEEMLCAEIPRGFLYYGEPRRRTEVAFTPELRGRVSELLAEMRQLYQRGYTPKVKTTAACKSCSLRELCLPKLNQNLSVERYLRAHLADGGEAE